jgi:hypothetical protein
LARNDEWRFAVLALFERRSEVQSPRSSNLARIDGKDYDLCLLRRERHFESMKKGRVVFSCDSFRFVAEEETMGFGMSRNFSGDHASEGLW